MPAGIGQTRIRDIHCDIGSGALTIDRNLVKRIREASNLLEIASEYTDLEEVGPIFLGFCPFQTCSSPSFLVDPFLKTYFCYGCGKQGDVISLVRILDGTDLLVTLKKLALKTGLVWTD